MVLLVTDLPGNRPRGDWRWPFLEALARTCCVSTACLAAGVSRFTAYHHRKRFPKFARLWDESIEVGVEVLEVEARSRALNPSDPASHNLLMFLLRAHKPQVYRDNGHLTPAVEADEPKEWMTQEQLARLSMEDLNTLEAIASKLVGEAG